MRRNAIFYAVPTIKPALKRFHTAWADCCLPRRTVIYWGHCDLLLESSRTGSAALEIVSSRRNTLKTYSFPAVLVVHLDQGNL